MLAHSIKPILSLVPEALDFVKQASVAEDYPVDNVDSCIASALELKYHEFIDQKPVDIFAIEKVASAVKLYAVGDKVASLSEAMVKAARAKSLEDMKNPAEEYLTKQANLEGETTGFNNILELADTASDLYKQASTLGVEPSEMVRRYSGNGYLDKKAAVEGLAARFQATNNVNFVKLASSLGRMDTLSLKPETVFDVCKTVSAMDRETGISALGFNFFKEAVLTKSAASVLTVTLGKTQVPYEKIEKLGRSRIAQYIGEDVAKEMDAGPENMKQVLETLPADLQNIVCNLLKHV